MAAVRYQALDMLRPPSLAQDQNQAGPDHATDSGQAFMEASSAVLALITPKQTRV